MLQTKKRNSYFLFFVFLFSINCYAINDKPYTKNCLNSSSIIYSELSDTVDTAFEIWNEEITKDTRSNSVIVVKSENKLILFTYKLNIQKNLKQQLVTDRNLKVLCIGEGNIVPFIAFLNTKPSELSSERLFYFIDKKTKNFDDISDLKQYFDKILLINAKEINNKILEEIQLTIAHESIHLFSQEKFLKETPFYNPLSIEEINSYVEYYSKNGVDSSTVNRQCEIDSNTISTMPTREYLEYKYNCIRSIRKLVVEEACLNMNLLDSIQRYKKDKQTYDKLQALIILKDIFNILKQRNELFNDNNIAIEWYWYLAEGIPQYYEQKLLLQFNPTRVIQNYEELCSSSETSTDQFFYPLLTGAAIWHGLEFIFETNSEWSELAQQSIENLPQQENAHLWFSSWFYLLKNRLQHVGLN